MLSVNVLFLQLLRIHFIVEEYHQQKKKLDKHTSYIAEIETWKINAYKEDTWWNQIER